MNLPHGFDQLEERAREFLSASAAAYYSDAAYSDAARSHSADRENLRAWARLALRPRVLVDVSKIATETTVLGDSVALPVLAAPCAFAGFAHPEAECAVARATGRAGTVQIVSSAATRQPEEIAEAGSGPQWFQLYTDPDRALTDARIQAAADQGYRALVFTVDAPVGAPRYSGYPEEGFGRVATGQALDPTFDWTELQRLVAGTKLPVALKGVLHPDDAVLAVEHGVAAVVVSNHGGRQLDGALPTARALPDIVESVDGRAEVYVDGGVRSARDVLRALALGARAVLVGRPYLWALAIAGEEGVVELFDRLGAELRNAMMLTGQVDAQRVARDIVVEI